MMAFATEENLAFIEEIQQYDCLYNKYIRDFKNKFKRHNCWVEIAAKFDITPEAAEKRCKNIRTAYGRYLKKTRNVPSGSGRDAVPRIPKNFSPKTYVFFFHDVLSLFYVIMINKLDCSRNCWLIPAILIFARPKSNHESQGSQCISCDLCDQMETGLSQGSQKSQGSQCVSCVFLRSYGNQTLRTNEV